MEFIYRPKLGNYLSAHIMRRKPKGLSKFVKFKKGAWLGHIDGIAMFKFISTDLINDFSKESAKKLYPLFRSTGEAQ